MQRFHLPLLALVLGLSFDAAAAEVEFSFETRFGKRVDRSPGITNYPSGITVDPSTGAVYVMDLLFNRVQKFDAEGRFLTEWQRPKALGLTIDPSAQVLWVAAWEEDKVVKYDANGKELLALGTGKPGKGPGEFDMPHDVGVDYRNGDLYVLDSNNKRVQVFSREGSYKREFPGRFVEPFGISVHPKGDFLCVADPGSREVIKFSLEGQELARFGGQGSSAGKFRWSRDCAIDEQGHIYVADTDNERAQKLDADGNFMGFIIGPNTRDKGSFHPRSIAVNTRTGEIYAAAAYANRVDRFNPELKHIQSWGAHNKDGPVFSTPRSIAVNPKNGEIYVGDFWDHRVRRFDATGKYLGSFDGWAPTQTDLQGNPLPPDFATTPETVMWVSKEDQFFPVALGIDADSNVWVIREAMHYDDDPRMQADWIIRRYTADGRFIEGFGSTEFPRNAKMRGLAVDPAAQVLYIANSENHRLMKFDFKGNRLWAVGGKGSAESQFNWPSAVALDPQRKRLYVVDVENNRVQKFDTDGNFIKSWGKPGKGPGDFAFNGFSSISVDAKGYVYVGDTKNARVQVFDPEGRYVSSVGQPGQGAEGKWNNFSGIAVLKDRLYVVDTNGYEVEIWKIKHGD